MTKPSFVIISILAFFMLSVSSPIYSQISGNNTLEYQFGKLPVDTTSWFSTVYNRSVIKYKHKGFTGRVGIEQFHSPYEERNYTKLQQYSLLYKQDGLKINVGHFYETIGRGLLLRSYEVKNAILEDLSYRSRHYFHRDIKGVSVGYKASKLGLKGIYGQPLNYLFPPTIDESIRRPDIIQALQADYELGKHSVGSAFMQLENDLQNSQYLTVFSSGPITKSLNYYIEAAKNINNTSINNFTENSEHALYGNLNYTWKNLGIVTEFKSYQNFLLGSGINEPPALVKEHTFTLLNRSTHVLQPANENGIQTEVYYMFKDMSMLTVNFAYAKNNFGADYEFYELFGEYSFTLNKKHDMKLFADYAQEDINSEEDRISSGINAQWKLKKKKQLSTTYEFQNFKRFDESVSNHLFALGVSNGTKFNTTLSTELSNDSFVTDNSKMWAGVTTSYKLNRKNSIYVFAGSRRGGPACNAGICYEVPDFEGIEIRLKTRF